MDKSHTESIDDRARGLIKDAAAKIAEGRKAGVMGSAGNTSGDARERRTSVRKDEAVDPADIDIYGAHPSDD